MTKAPLIYPYLDYRQYLTDWVEGKRVKGRFSYRKFAIKAGFKSHEILKLVITSKRNLSVKSIHKFCQGLSLTVREARYFESLVLMNQATTAEEKLLYYRRLVTHPGRQKVVPLEKSQLGFFEHWLTPVLYEMLHLEHFKPDPTWIRTRLNSELPISQIKEALAGLLRSGFVHVLLDGSWLPKEIQLATGDRINDVHLFAYHEQALAKASDALHEIPSTQRYFNVYTTAIPKKAMPKLFELAKAFEDGVRQCIAEEGPLMDDVVQVSLQIFRILNSDGEPT